MSTEPESFQGLFAVVVNWNGGAQDNLRCLESLFGEGLPEGRVVFVDNASRDGSLEAVRARFPGLVYLENSTNLGFGEAANQGAQVAMERGAAAVVFINNDLWLPSGEGVLFALAEALDRDPELGMVGPRVLFGTSAEHSAAERQGAGVALDSTVWCAGGRLDFRQNLSTLLGNGDPDGPPWNETRDVDYVVGCALMARTKCLEEVGLFDPSYFAYMEDVELGLRAREAGWGVRVLGAHRAFHAPSSATGGGYGARRKWMQALNSVRFLKRHGTPYRWLRFALFDVATLPVLLLLKAPKGEASAVLAKAKGLVDGARGKRVTARQLEPGASRLWPT